MTGAEFFRKLQDYAKRHDLPLVFVPARGKGSHGTVLLAERRTTLKDRKKEIGIGLLRAMLKDLGISPDEF